MADVQYILYPSSDEYSMKRAAELLVLVARRGEESGFGIPCLFIAAKDDLDSYPMAIQDSEMVFPVPSVSRSCLYIYKTIRVMFFLTLS